MKKTLFTLLAIAGLLMTADTSQAGLGWSFDQCVQHYGQIVTPNRRMDDSSIACHFSVRGYDITAFFDTNTVSRIVCISNSGFDTAGVEDFLTSNCPGAVWSNPARDYSDGSYRWHGNIDGAYAYFASLRAEGHRLIIWTRADNDVAIAHGAEEANGL